MPRVTLTGAEHLPVDIDPERLLYGAREICLMLGIKGRISIEVHKSKAKYPAYAITKSKRAATVELHTKTIDRRVRAHDWQTMYMPSFADARVRFYCDYVCHELCHISQVQRGSRGLEVWMAEVEANAAENVYGPALWRIVTEQPNKKGTK